MSDNATMKNTTIHDMTTGSPARLIMQFMIPMFLGSTGCNWKYGILDVLCDRLAEWSE